MSFNLTINGVPCTFVAVETTNNRVEFVNVNALSRDVAEKVVIKDTAPNSQTNKKGSREISVIIQEADPDNAAAGTGRARVVRFYYELYAEDSFTDILTDFRSKSGLLQAASNLTELENWVKTGGDV